MRFKRKYQNYSVIRITVTEYLRSRCDENCNHGSKYKGRIGDHSKKSAGWYFHNVKTGDYENLRKFLVNEIDKVIK